jgi:hypothetical protein
VKVLAHALVEQ